MGRNTGQVAAGRFGGKKVGRPTKEPDFLVVKGKEKGVRESTRAKNHMRGGLSPSQETGHCAPRGKEGFKYRNARCYNSKEAKRGVKIWDMVIHIKEDLGREEGG